MPDLDKPKKDEEGTSTPEERMTGLMEGFNEMVGEVRTALTTRPEPVAPVIAPKVDNSAERKAAAQKAYEASHEKVNELIASGEGAAAMETYMEGVLKLQAANLPDPENNPQVKAGIASAKKLSRAENADMFKKYGPEIEADMAALSADERINPESWDDAVNRVKANHIDDIIADRTKQNAEDIEKADAAARATAAAPPVALRSGRANQGEDGISADNLTTEQLDAAEACDLTPEKYAQAVVDYDKHTLKGGNVLFLNEPTKGLKIAPGKF